MLNVKKILLGLNLIPNSGSVVTAAGDVAYNTSTSQVEIFTSGVEQITTNANTQTISNKTFVAPALGTPASGVATNLTGTASGLTAGNINATSNSTLTTLTNASGLTLATNTQISNTSSALVGGGGNGSAQGNITWQAAAAGYTGMLWNSSASTGADGLSVKVSSTNISTFALDISSGATASAHSRLFAVNGNGNVQTVDNTLDDGSGNATFAGTIAAKNTVEVSSSGSPAAFFESTNTGGLFVAGIDNSTGSNFGYGAFAGCVVSPTNLVFGTNGGTKALSIDTSQNVTFAGNVTLGSTSNGSLQIGGTNSSLNFQPTSGNSFIDITSIGSSLVFRTANAIVNDTVPLTLAANGAATFVGNVAIGGATSGALGLFIANSNLTGTNQAGLQNGVTLSSGATGSGSSYLSAPSTAAASFTVPVFSHYQANDISKGSGSAITRYITLWSNTGHQGTNNAIVSDNNSFTGNYLINQSGTDPSVFGGTVTSAGVTSGSNATAGTLGEFISANSAGVAVGTSNTFVNITSISLTAGDWDVDATAAFVPGASTAGTIIAAAISTSSGAFDSQNKGGVNQIPGAISTVTQYNFPTGRRRINVSTTTTIYLVGYAFYTVNGSATWGANSLIQARRVR